MRRLLCLLVLAIWPAVQAEEWQAGRLPWGDPDLQGIWTNATVTTLERPERFEELVLSEREVLAVEEFSAQRIESIDDLPEVIFRPRETLAATILSGWIQEQGFCESVANPAVPSSLNQETVRYPIDSSAE